MIDQAQHFAALGSSGGGGHSSTGDAAQSFREGLDGTERECTPFPSKYMLALGSLTDPWGSVRNGSGKRQVDQEMV